MVFVIIAAVIGLLIGAHAAGGVTHHRYQRAAGLRPNVYWSLGRGVWASVRLPGGFRIGHRL